jgi:outer membrane protein assembly factor BamB
MSAIVDWYYAVSGGALHQAAEGPGSRWTTGPLGLQTAPAVKESIRKVWAGTGDGQLYAFDALDGRIVRTTPLGNAITYTGCHGPNLVVVLGDGQLIALDPQTEAIRWSTQVGGSDIESMVETNGVLLVLLLNAAAIAFDADTGAELWRTGYTGAAAGADHGIFYLVNFERMLEARRAADGGPLWSVTDPDVNYSAVNVYAGTVYVTSEDLVLRALAEDSGAVRWTADLPGFAGTPLYSPVGEGEPSLIVPFGETGGKPSPGLACYSPGDGTRLWTVGPLAGGDVGERPIHPPTRFYTGCAGLPNEGLVYFYYVDGTLKWPQFEPWDVGPDMAGLAYLNGELGTWTL